MGQFTGLTKVLITQAFRLHFMGQVLMSTLVYKKKQKLYLEFLLFFSITERINLKYVINIIVEINCTSIIFKYLDSIIINIIIQINKYFLFLFLL